MTQEAGTPPGFWQRVEQVAERVVARAMRSGANRNASLGAGGRFTIKGGALVVEAADGSTSAYFGGIYPAMPDGTVQPGFILRREDGSLAAALYDPTPDPASPDGFKQFFAIYDRGGRIVFSDDTSSGQGIARPYVGGGFARARYADWGVSTTSAAFETLFEQRIWKQHPRLEVGIRASTTDAATTGETRVLVNGVQLGAVSAEEFVMNYRFFGPAAIAGDHMQTLDVLVQGRVTGGAGALRVEPRYWMGRQS